MSWLDSFRWPKAALADLQFDMGIALGRLQKMSNQLNTMENKMADVSPLLNQLAQDLRSFGQGPFKALVDENTRLAARNAELEGEDAAESAAAADAVAAFNSLVNPVTEAPEVPVEIPPVDAPAEPTDETPADTDGDAPPAA